MPSLRLLSSTVRHTYIVTIILSLGKVILLYSRYIEKGLVYIVIVAPSSHQSFSYAECTHVNMHSSYNVRLVSNTKYIYTYCISL